jgi:hypothetical protein
MDFANQKVFDLLKIAQPGEVYEIEVGKNDKGYDTWMSAAKSTAKAPEVKPDSPRGSWGAKNNNETPEERAIKQLYIVRQMHLTSLRLTTLRVVSPWNKC